MELKSCTYATVTTLGDFGPWISKVVLDLPCTVRANDVNEHTFNIYCARHERAGEVLMRKEHGADHAAPSVGYVPVLATYPCDENGQRLPKGTHVALETPEVRLTKEIEGGVLGSRYIESRLRVTQLVALPGEDGDDPTAGLVFDRSRGDICPALKGWHNAVQQTPVDGIALEYGYFEPSFEPADSALFNPFAPKDTPAIEKAPLIVYLHGAGEGKGTTQGEGATRAYTGNRVTALSQKQIQRYFGGFAWVLVPQSPTFWMDNGVEQLGRSNQSIYSPVLKALIDEFVAEHADRIDTDRIVVAGLSNGGFMTLRLCADYPEFFAAGLPCCAPWYNATDEDVAVVAGARVTTLLESRFRKLTGLEKMRVARYAPLVRELASQAEDDENGLLLAMLVDAAYQESLGHVQQLPEGRSESSRRGDGEGRGRKRSSRRRRDRGDKAAEAAAPAVEAVADAAPAADGNLRINKSNGFSHCILEQTG